MRCILGYFMDIPTEEIPYIKVPLHTIIKLTPTAHSEELLCSFCLLVYKLCVVVVRL